jgi:nucleoside-diphosphate-sugar epimerase
VRRILLLGGTGFIGSHVLAALRPRSDVRLTVLAHRMVDFRALEDVDLIVSDLSCLDLTWLDVTRPDTIIHLARLSGRGRIGRARAASRGRRANARLADWLRAHAPDTHVVYVSGTLVYGDGGDADLDEDTPLRPTAYAREYVVGEIPWMEAQSDGSLPVTIVRPPWVMGPGSWFHAFYALPAVHSGQVPVYGAGTNWMTFIDVADCGAAVAHVAEHAEPGGVVNLFAPGQIARQSVFARAVAEALGLPVPTGAPVCAKDRAAQEALATSCRAATIHTPPALGYEFRFPRWQDMVARHVPPSAHRDGT